MKRKEPYSPKPPHKNPKSLSWKDEINLILKQEANIKTKPVQNKEKPSEIVEPEAKIKEDSLIDKNFHLEQAKKRSQIRLEQGRGNTFDKLLQVSLIYIGEIFLPESEEVPIEIIKPYVYLEQCSSFELESVKTAIEVHVKLEKSREIQDYWENMLTIAEFRITYSPGFLQERIDKLLMNKNIEELGKLKKEIVENMQSTVNMDKSFWQDVLVNIDAYKAKKKLEDMYVKRTSRKKDPVLGVMQKNILQINGLFFKKSEVKVNYDDGSHSPVLVSESSLDSSLIILTPDQASSLYTSKRQEIFTRELELLKKSQSRLSIKNNPLLLYDNMLLDIDSQEKIVSGSIDQSIEDIMRLEIIKKLPQEENEGEFNELATIKPVIEDWMRKFKPRKPKFFNRIKTGYEWNRHNQTHYNHLNTPPKVVQGYKFNIFYPYLIDKTKAPQFYLQPGETDETCVIRFHAGPPYEDIAFKIVNREWDFSDRNGFKCFFDKGILHLYFNFKRHRYKR